LEGTHKGTTLTSAPDFGYSAITGAAMLKGKKIIVAGIAGRIGQGIGEYLLECGSEVWGYDLFYQEGSQEFWEAAGAHTVRGDFAKGEFGGLPEDADYCINLAANTMPANFSQGLRDNAMGPALLLQRCKKAKAFMHFSSCSVYTPKEGPAAVYAEEDAVGSDTEGFYSGSKIAGEGAVAAMAKALGVPAIQLRLSVYYGTHGDGGLLALVYLANLVNGLPIEIMKKKPSYFSCIYDREINSFLESLLNAASPDAPIVNLIGDENPSVEELAAYMGELAGIKPRYQFVDRLSWPAMVISHEKRAAITGPSAWPWKKGVKELVEFWLPKLEAEKERAAQASRGSRAKYTRETRLKEISGLPGIVDFLSHEAGQKVAPYALKVAGGISIQKAGSYLKWSDAQIQNVVDKLNKKYP
jgi:nucleoside-diphosphate-sugar epimerase